MTPHDKARAIALTKIFSAQELEYITDWIMAAHDPDWIMAAAINSDQNQFRVEDIIWEAHGMAVQSMDNI